LPGRLTAGAAVNSRTRIALISNPRSTGNIADLPRIRAYCDEHPDVFHYEVEHAHQVGEALRTIARIEPKVLVINGGDGTVQAALTEIHNGGYFGDDPPPVAVLPSGKTNLIALDLGAQGDPVEALERLLEIARTDLTPYVVDRELIALRHGEPDGQPVIGMFMGGAGLADTMLYCREKIYPLGLPNSLAHVLTAIALLFKLLLNIKANFLPPDPQPLNVSVADEDGRLSGKFSLLAVTTLDKLLLSSEIEGKAVGWRAQAGRDRRASGAAGPGLRSEPGRKPRPAEDAGSPFRASRPDHHPRRKLGRDPRRRDLPRSARKSDPPAARAATFVRQAGGLSHPSCRSFARSSPRN
jgi:hypothetical protein